MKLPVPVPGRLLCRRTGCASGPATRMLAAHPCIQPTPGEDLGPRDSVSCRHNLDCKCTGVALLLLGQSVRQKKIARSLDVSRGRGVVSPSALRPSESQDIKCRRVFFSSRLTHSRHLVFTFLSSTDFDGDLRAVQEHASCRTSCTGGASALGVMAAIGGNPSQVAPSVFFTATA